MQGLSGACLLAPRWSTLALCSCLALMLMQSAIGSGQGHIRHRWNEATNASAQIQQARSMLAQAGISTLDSRLAVVVLHTHPLSEAKCQDPEEKAQLAALKCSITTYLKHMDPKTPCDVFVFVRPRHMADAPDWLKVKGVYVLPINEETWSLPDYLRPRHQMGWVTGATDDYRLMGDWRLTFMPAFAKGMGYRYVLQTDSDTFIKAPVGVNLVDVLTRENVAIANRDQTYYEATMYMDGLPELMAFWLVSRNQKVVGSLFKHTKPADQSGLFTTDNGGGNPDWQGWDGQMLSGHFVILNVEWWHDKWIQDFVHLVVRTGAHLEHRWNEVAVQTILQQTMLPENRVKTFTSQEVAVEHGHKGGAHVQCYGLFT